MIYLPVEAESGIAPPIPLPLAGGVRGGQEGGHAHLEAPQHRRARELRNAATPAERHLWRFLSHSRLGHEFGRQMPVGPLFADFLYRENKLIVELDGFSHDLQPGRDVGQDKYLSEAGYRVLHFSNA